MTDYWFTVQINVAVSHDDRCAWGQIGIFKVYFPIPFNVGFTIGVPNITVTEATFTSSLIRADLLALYLKGRILGVAVFGAARFASVYPWIG